ncbi:MAG: efflux RND transporter permease subunit, partial [Pirellulales bacterium]
MLGGVVVAGWTLDVVTVGGPTLIVVIVIATTIHFAHYYSAEHGGASGRAGAVRRLEGRSGPDGQVLSAAHFIRWVAVPCLGAAATTGVGFLMLAFNELGPIRELGFELFAGALLAFLGAYLVWLVFHPLRAVPGRLLSTERLQHLQQPIVHWPRTTIVALVAAMIALAYAATRIRIDADPFSFFQPDAPIARALEHFRQRQFGLYNLEVVLIPRDGELDAEDRRVVRQFQERIERRPEVRKVVSTLQIAEHPLAFLLKRFFPGWIDREDQGGFRLRVEDLNALRITFMTHDTGEGFGDLVNEVRAALPQDRFDAFYTGAVAQVVLLSEGLVGGIAKGLGTAMVVMALLCVLLFRSLRLALLAFLPNVLPIVVVFGMMGALGVPLNSGSAMVATIALGIALTDTVHLVLHYRRRRDEGEGTDDAVANTFAHVGRPIVLTSVVNCAGFGIFLLSDFRPLYDFGLLAGVAMAAALLGDLVLLPNLLKVFDRVPRGRSAPEPAEVEPAEEARPLRY